MRDRRPVGRDYRDRDRIDKIDLNGEKIFFSSEGGLGGQQSLGASSGVPTRNTARTSQGNGQCTSNEPTWNTANVLAVFLDCDITSISLGTFIAFLWFPQWGHHNHMSWNTVSVLCMSQLGSSLVN